MQQRQGVQGHRRSGTRDDGWHQDKGKMRMQRLDMELEINIEQYVGLSVTGYVI